MHAIKCVVVGDGVVGKTCLINRYVTKEFRHENIPTVFDNCTMTITIADEVYTMGIFDTGGMDDYDRLRPLCYPDTDVFLICFSVAKLCSFENVKEKWIEEIKHYCPNTPFLLVGTQTDLRIEPVDSLKFVSTEKGRDMAKELGAITYVECSAITDEGVENVFCETAIAALNQLNNTSKHKTCHII